MGFRFITSLLLSSSFLFGAQKTFSQSRDLNFYLQQGIQNNPVLKEKIGLQSITGIQNQLINAQYHSPQISVTGDYLLSPFFNSNGKAIAITSEPSSDAYGYDVDITNGGLYSALLNVNVPLFTKGITAPLLLQNKTQFDQLGNEQQLVRHELEKHLTDLFIIAFQYQQQIQTTKEIMLLMDQRISVVKQLAEKGLMAQSDYLLLQIEKGNRVNDLLNLQFQFKSVLIQLNDSCGIRDTGFVQLIPLQLDVSARKTSFSYQDKFRIDSLNNMVKQEVFNTKYQPQLSVFGNTGLNATYAPEIPHNFGFSAGVHLSVPIYDGNQKKINNDIMQLNQKIIGQYKSNYEIVLNNNLDLLESQMQQKQKNISFQQQQLEQYKTLLSVYEQQVINGQLSVIDYLATVEKYRVAQQSIVQSQTDLLLLISQYNYFNW